MSGKKVFTHAGEKLANFLLATKQDTTKEIALEDILNKINKTEVDIYQGVSKDWYTRDEVIAHFKQEFVKELSYVNVTDGQKKIFINEMVQFLYNNLKHLELLSEAQYQALNEVFSIALADLFKDLADLDKKFTKAIADLAIAISNLQYKPLDYFLGSTEDKKRLYYRFNGNQLVILNGAGTNVKAFEVFRMVALTATGTNQSLLGDKMVIGGLESDSPIKKIEMTKELFVQGNITVQNGGEFIGTAARARYADLAEYYSSDGEYRPGTLLEIDTKGQNEVTIHDGRSYNHCIGVVSDRPGFILNDELRDDPNNVIVQVVLTGKSPVRVRGPVQKGDLLYPSGKVLGVAEAINPDNYDAIINYQRLGVDRIGYALSSFHPIEIDSDTDYKFESLIMSKLG